MKQFLRSWWVYLLLGIFISTSCSETRQLARQTKRDVKKEKVTVVDSMVVPIDDIIWIDSDGDGVPDTFDIDNQGFWYEPEDEIMIEEDEDASGVVYYYDVVEDVQEVSFEDVPYPVSYSTMDDDITSSVTIISMPDIEIVDVVHTEDMVEAVIQSSWGKLAFEVPKNMKVGKPSSIKLRIAEKGGSAGAGGLTEGLRNPEVRSIITSEIMGAVLHASDQDAFIIITTTEENQYIKDGQGEWVWLVTPLFRGEYSLIVTAHTTVKVYDNEYRKGKEVFNEVIQIKANPVYSFEKWWRKNWKWAWTVILLPGFKWVIPLFFRRKKKEEEEEEPNT